jgi:MarR family transcriptional regulator, organic hydroperoxide resistance regulator
LIMVVNEKPNIQPTEISEKILLAPSTITRMVEKLEKRNILSRVQESKYTFITSTQKGQDLYLAIVKKWGEIDDIYLSRLGAETVSNLVVGTFEAAKKLKN